MTARLRAIASSASAESSTGAPWRATATTSAKTSGPGRRARPPTRELTSRAALNMQAIRRRDDSPRSRASSPRLAASVSDLRQNASNAPPPTRCRCSSCSPATPRPCRPATIARDLGLPRSTTYHLLNVLRDEGFVVHLPEERRYGLGVAAYELGSAYLRQDPLRWIAQTVLDRASSPPPRTTPTSPSSTAATSCT